MVFWGQGKYFNDALLTETEKIFIFRGKYLTDQLNELAIEYIGSASKKNKPYAISWSQSIT